MLKRIHYEAVDRKYSLLSVTINQKYEDQEACSVIEVQKSYKTVVVGLIEDIAGQAWSKKVVDSLNVEGLQKVGSIFVSRVLWL